MKKWVCSVCGYVYEGDTAPAQCPICHVSGDKFVEQSAGLSWASEHVVGVGKSFGSDVPADVHVDVADARQADETARGAQRRVQPVCVRISFQEIAGGEILCEALDARKQQKGGDDPFHGLLFNRCPPLPGS